MTLAGRPSELQRLLYLLTQDASGGVHASHAAMSCVAEELGAKAAWLYRKTPSSLVLAGASGSTDELVQSLDDIGIAARCAETNAPQMLAASALLSLASADQTLFHLEGHDIEAAPLRVNGELVGVLVHATPAGTAHSSQERLEAVIAILALAVAAMGRREPSSAIDRRLVGTLHAVVSVLLEQASWYPIRRSSLFGERAAFDEKEYLTVLARGAAAITHAEIVAVGVGTDAERPFDPWISVGVSSEVETKIGPHPRPVGTLGAVAIGGEAIRVRELSEHPAFIGLPPHHPPVHSLLAIPIRIRGRSFGNVYLANKKDVPEFFETDQHIMELLAALAALGLHFAHLATNAHERETILQILEAAPDGVLYLDKATGNVLVSRSLERIYGRAFDPLTGIAQVLGSLCWPDGTSLEHDELPSVRALHGIKTVDLELLIVRPDGEHVPVSERAHPFIVNGEIHGSLVSVRDISSLKESERVREEFAAMVVHDLRSPIQSMLLQIQVLRSASEAGKPTSSAGWDRLVRSATRLAQMASDMLDSTRIELSRVALARTSTDLAAAVKHVVDNMQSVHRDHRIVVDAPEDLPQAMVDVVRFDQILTNLLDNAAKHSEDGSTIHVGLRAVNDGIEIAVRDQGVGISSEELPKLFDRFHQARRAREHKTGLGLGLHIAKGLTEAHGGSIHAESVIDRGSTFRVWLPASEREQAHPPERRH